MDQMQRNSFAVSNLGVFDSVHPPKKESTPGIEEKEKQKGDRTITGTQSSDSAMKALYWPDYKFWYREPEGQGMCFQYGVGESCVG